MATVGDKGYLYIYEDKPCTQQIEDKTTIGQVAEGEEDKTIVLVYSGRDYILYSANNMLGGHDLYSQNKAEYLKHLKVSLGYNSYVTSLYSAFGFCYDLEDVEFISINTSACDDMSHMFCGCESLTTITGIEKLDTFCVQDMTEMFDGCEALVSLDLSSFDTFSLVYADEVFYCCHNLKSVDVSTWDTSQVVSACNMFEECYELETLDVSNWDMHNARYICGMFSECSSLQEIDVSNWGVLSVEHIEGLFHGCSSIQSLDLSSWDTQNLQIAYFAFGYCTSLQILDLSGWTIPVDCDVDYMFSGCDNLEYLIIGSTTFKFNMPDSNCGDLPTTTKILVPSNLLNTFKTAPNWSSRADQFDAIENYTITRSNGRVTVTPIVGGESDNE